MTTFVVFLLGYGSMSFSNDTQRLVCKLSWPVMQRLVIHSAGYFSFRYVREEYTISLRAKLLLCIAGSTAYGSQVLAVSIALD